MSERNSIDAVSERNSIDAVSERNSIDAVSAHSTPAVSRRSGINPQVSRGADGPVETAHGGGAGFVDGAGATASTGAARPGVATATGLAGTGRGQQRGTAPNKPSPSTASRERNDHDAATVLAVVLAMTGHPGAGETPSNSVQSVWNDPSFRLGAVHPSPVAWWASAMPR